MVKAKPIPGLRADVPYARAAAATIRVRSAELLEQAEGVLDTDAIERVHGMRVASRRLRAVLEVYAPCFPPAELRTALRDVKRLADALGARRDPDVQLEGLERFAAALPAPDQPGLRRFMDAVRAEQQQGNVRLADALRRLDQDGLGERLRALADAADARVPVVADEPASGADDPASGGEPASGTESPVRDAPPADRAARPTATGEGA